MEILNFNQQGYEIEVSRLKKQLETYNKILDSFEVITQKKETLSIENLDSFIKEKTSFANVQMSAQLLGVETEYNYILENVNKYDLSNFNLDSNKIAISVKESVLNELKEHFTTYLSKDKEEVYKKLNKALNILNELHPTISKCISQDYKGQYSINKMALHNLDRI